MTEGIYNSVGRRKTSVARVRITAGSGVVKINRQTLDEYFNRDCLKLDVMRPLEITSNMGKFDIFANVNGGGTTGQAGAIKHGLSRALLTMDPTLRNVLKKAGLLKRDPRMVERKKYGQKGARARFQFSKR